MDVGFAVEHGETVMPGFLQPVIINFQEAVANFPVFLRVKPDIDADFKNGFCDILACPVS